MALLLEENNQYVRQQIAGQNEYEEVAIGDGCGNWLGSRDRTGYARGLERRRESIVR